MNPYDRRKYPMRLWVAVVICPVKGQFHGYETDKRERRTYMLLANCEADARCELWNGLSVARIFGWRLLSIVEHPEPIYHLSTGSEG